MNDLLKVFKAAGLLISLKDSKPSKECDFIHVIIIIIIIIIIIHPGSAPRSAQLTESNKRLQTQHRRLLKYQASYHHPE